MMYDGPLVITFYFQGAYFLQLSRISMIMKLQRYLVGTDESGFMLHNLEYLLFSY